jgi:hypothetical protein
MPQMPQPRSGPVPASRPAAPRPVVVQGPAPRTKRRAPVLVLLALLVAANLAGLPYYRLSQAERVRSPLHAWLRPAGTIGQAAGVLALLLFLFMWLYPLRKKFRWLAFTGSIARWLDVHIAAGLCIPLLGAMHAAWRFDGLIGLGYFSMMVVVLSGVIGKYLYARIPRGRSGLEMSLEEIQTESRVLLKYVASTTGMPLEEVERILAPRSTAANRGVLGTLGEFVADDWQRFRAFSRLKRGWRAAKGGRPVDRQVVRLVRRMARQQMALRQQMRLLDGAHRLFRYWHVAHRPVAISALVAVAIHVGVAVAMGVPWFY